MNEHDAASVTPIANVRGSTPSVFAALMEMGSTTSAAAWLLIGAESTMVRSISAARTPRAPITSLRRVI